MAISVPGYWREQVHKLFPDLQEGVSLEFTSPVDYNYNCLAWAVSCDTRYFENNKGCFWPWQHISDETPDGWVEVCKIHGFYATENTEFIPGVEKIAILVNAEGDLHAARQGKNGWWKSKLGGWGPDHVGLDGLVPAYGKVVHVLQRERRDWMET